MNAQNPINFISPIVDPTIQQPLLTPEYLEVAPNNPSTFVDAAFQTAQDVFNTQNLTGLLKNNLFNEQRNYFESLGQSTEGRSYSRAEAQELFDLGNLPQWADNLNDSQIRFFRDIQLRESRRKAIVDQEWSKGIAQQAGLFGIMAAGNLLDPLAIGTGVIAESAFVKGVGYLGKLATASKSASYLRAAQNTANLLAKNPNLARYGKQLTGSIPSGTNLIESLPILSHGLTRNVLGNTFAEAITSEYIQRPLLEAEGQEFTREEQFLQLGFAGLLGGGIYLGSKAFGGIGNVSRELANTPLTGRIKAGVLEKIRTGQDTPGPRAFADTMQEALDALPNERTLRNTLSKVNEGQALTQADFDTLAKARELLDVDDVDIYRAAMEADPSANRQIIQKVYDELSQTDYAATDPIQTRDNLLNKALDLAALLDEPLLFDVVEKAMDLDLPQASNLLRRFLGQNQNLPTLPKTPKQLRGAKPRFRHIVLDFESPLDKALYIVRNPQTKSAKHDLFMDYLRKAFPGKDDAEIARFARQTFNDHIKPNVTEEGIIKASPLAESFGEGDVLRSERIRAFEGIFKELNDLKPAPKLLDDLFSERTETFRELRNAEGRLKAIRTANEKGRNQSTLNLENRVRNAQTNLDRLDRRIETLGEQPTPQWFRDELANNQQTLEQLGVEVEKLYNLRPDQARRVLRDKMFRRYDMLKNSVENLNLASRSALPDALEAERALFSPIEAEFNTALLRDDTLTNGEYLKGQLSQLEQDIAVLKELPYWDTKAQQEFDQLIKQAADLDGYRRTLTDAYSEALTCIAGNVGGINLGE